MSSSLPELAAEAERTRRPSLPLWQGLQDALVALSLANLCFLNASFRLLYSADKGYFNKLGPVLPSLLALVVNLGWTTLACWWLIRVWRRSSRLWLRFILEFLFFLALLLPLDFCRRNVLQIQDYKVLSCLTAPLTLFGGVVFLGLFLWQHERFARWAGVLLAVLSPLAFFALARACLLACGAPEFATLEPSLPPLLPVREHQSRVVWLIFDETDQRLCFEQRPAEVRLPNFERLRDECFYATNAFPPGGSTLISMPGLISGKRFASIEILNNSDLRGVLADTGTNTNWSQLPSVFDSARALGFNTGLVGWYHPYARVLGRSLNYCSWHPFPSAEPARAATFGVSLERQFSALSGVPHMRRIYIDLCQASLTEALSLATNSNYGLLLFHLPPPHKPGIYSPETGKYALFGSFRKSTGYAKSTGYFNNLALADSMLAQLRSAMENAGEWDRTWLLLSADHSWRDSLIYDGRRDLRVPFLVKTPQAGRGLTYSAQFNTVLTHDLILAILGGQVTNQAGLVPWMDAHRSTEPTVLHKAGD